MKLITLSSLAGLAVAMMQPKQLNVSDSRSIRNVAATIAYDAMTYYKGNTSSDANAVGDVQDPYYWWVAGSLWGLIIDYYHVTKDPSYNMVALEALLAKPNLGPDNNYLPPEHAHEEGNDDLFFWGNAALTAAENNFPQPKTDLPSWLDISKKVFDWLEAHWNTSDCGGGVFWQIDAANPNGLFYKNTISNGGLFQFAARLARATGDKKYLDWADKVWDWTWRLNLIDHDNYHVYDGVDIRTKCQKVNHASFTYLSGIYLYGAAVMANHTGKPEWADRADRLLAGCSWFFFSSDNADDNKKNVMYEGACEPVDSCFNGNADMTTFKGYLATLMWKSTVMLPSLQPRVAAWLVPTAQAAARSCQGGDSGTQCDMKWSTGRFNGVTNLGPQMNALGAVQGLLIRAAPAPKSAGEIKRVLDANFAPVDPNRTDGTSERPKPTSTRTRTSTKTVKPPPPPSSVFTATSITSVSIQETTISTTTSFSSESTPFVTSSHQTTLDDDTMPGIMSEKGGEGESTEMATMAITNVPSSTESDESVAVLLGQNVFVAMTVALSCCVAVVWLL